jgi:hypothetical protein
LKLGRQQSEKAEVIVITKIMPYSGTNRFFTGTTDTTCTEALQIERVAGRLGRTTVG